MSERTFDIDVLKLLKPLEVSPATIAKIKEEIPEILEWLSVVEEIEIDPPETQIEWS